MKIVAFTDVHADMAAMKAVAVLVKKEKPDLVICTGDIADFGVGLQKTIDKIAKLHKQILLLPGQPPHENAAQVRKACKPHKNIIFLHKKVKVIDGITFFGWGGGGFNKIEPDFEAFVKKIKDKIKGKNVVCLTHAPPRDTKLDYTPHAGHVGNLSLTRFLKKKKNIVIALSGHIHESFGKRDKVGNVVVANPGPRGKVIRLKA